MIGKIIRTNLLFFVLILMTVYVFLSVQLLFDDSKIQASIQNSFETDIPNYSIEQDFLIQENKSKTVNAKSFISLKIKYGNFQGKDLGEDKHIIFSKSEKEKLPIASLTKLMTALVVLKNYDLNEEVSISEAAMAQEGVQGVLKLGEILTVKDLLYITLIESSNRAAYALSEVIGTDKFVGLMNKTSQELGLENTYFKDSTGLDEGSYSSAEDLAKLSGYLFENYPLFSKIVGLKKFDLYLKDGSLHHSLENTNRLLGELPFLVGGKTGWTNVALGCVMIIQQEPETEDYLVYVILGAEDRFLEMEKLINQTYNDSFNF